MSVTAATVRRNFLEPAMDARALNLDQARLLYDPSPEVDSLFEVSHAVATSPELRVARRHAPRLMHLLGQLHEKNEQEGDRQLLIAGAADLLVTDLRALELSGASPSALPAKAIARELREPLRRLLAPAGGDLFELLGDLRAVDRLIGRTPRAQLLSRTVRYELGKEKFALLERLCESATPPGSKEGVAEDHQGAVGGLDC